VNHFVVIEILTILFYTIYCLEGRPYSWISCNFIQIIIFRPSFV